MHTPASLAFLRPAALLAALALPSVMAAAMPPPMPIYDGCVVGDQVRIVTGPKRVIGRDERPFDLGPFVGKRIRFEGYLLREPTLVIVEAPPTVISDCRAAPHLPDFGLSLAEALRRSRILPASKEQLPPSTPMAAVVRSMERPLLSGNVEGRSLLSGRFAVVKVLSGTWPEGFQLHYDASVEAGERAIGDDETVILIPGRDKRAERFSALALRPHDDASEAAVKAALEELARWCPAGTRHTQRPDQPCIGGGRKQIWAPRIDFEIAKARLHPRALPIVDALAQLLQASPEIVELAIEGHTDDRGPARYGLQLDRKRAQAVRQRLIAQGVAPERLMAVGYGSERPLAPNKTAQGRRLNRRIDLVIRRWVDPSSP